MARFDWSLLHDIVANKRRKPVATFEDINTVYPVSSACSTSLQLDTRTDYFLHEYSSPLNCIEAICMLRYPLDSVFITAAFIRFCSLVTTSNFFVGAMVVSLNENILGRW
jgi:hypothetical protein